MYEKPYYKLKLTTDSAEKKYLNLVKVRYMAIEECHHSINYIPPSGEWIQEILLSVEIPYTSEPDVTDPELFNAVMSLYERDERIKKSRNDNVQADTIRYVRSLAKNSTESWWKKCFIKKR